MKKIMGDCVSAVFLLVLISAPAGVYAENIEAKLSTTNGSDAFQVQNSGGTPLLHVGSNGKLGIGTTNPVYKFHLSDKDNQPNNDMSAFISRYFDGTEAITAPDNVGMMIQHQMGNYVSNGTAPILTGLFVHAGPSRAAGKNSFSVTDVKVLLVQPNADNPYGDGGILTVTNLYGISVEPNIRDSGYPTIPGNARVSNLYGLRINSRLNNGGLQGNASNAYGLYIDKQYGYNTSYGIYQADSGDKNYFAGNVGIGTTTPSYQLDVNGTIRGTNVSPSDIRLKENIVPLDNALENVSSLRGVYFDWKDKTNGEGRNIGLIAQDVEKVYPEAVSEDHEGYKAVNYGKLVAVLVEAVKEQNKTIAALKALVCKDHSDAEICR